MTDSTNHDSRPDPSGADPSAGDRSAALTHTVRVDVGDPPRAGESVQLWFLGVEHAARSFETRVFLERPDADADTSLDDPRFAGSWSMYGHGAAASLPVHPVPRRAPAGAGSLERRTATQWLEPFDTVVDLTDALRRLELEGEVAVTIVPVDAKTGEALPASAALPKRLQIRRD